MPLPPSLLCFLQNEPTNPFLPTSPHRPTDLRATLSTFLTLFPHNTLLLSLLAWSQPSLPLLSDPVRAALHHALSLSSSSLSPHHHNHYSEKEEEQEHHLLTTHRLAILHESRVGTVHSTRAAYEAAVADCRGSVELWTGYVRFCCAERELRGKRAREVFYRAVGACPWAKEVYMLGFGLAREGVLGAAEVRGVVESLVERGVRVHVEMEGFLGGRG